VGSARAGLRALAQSAGRAAGQPCRRCALPWQGCGSTRVGLRVLP